ncbi:type VI secretion system membrane subunit TssM [Caballeronia sp. 15715]|uniref:type VI secretion system membrane subunit TssM n=1 Tax=Caballeronia sp. 15715 TaxID=3391030 RepID=UPI0039E6C7FB
MLKKIASILFHPLLLLALALGMTGALIWWIGPLIAIGAPDTYRPLDSERARVITIGVLVLVVVLRGLWLVARAIWRNHVLAAGLVGRAAHEAPQAYAEPEPGAEEIVELGRRFDRAVAALREARVNAAGSRPGWRDWLSMSGRQYLYRLPWYVLIGAPGSGKTTVLEYSGLQFPLADKLGDKLADKLAGAGRSAPAAQAASGAGWHASRIDGIGGTRHCDWWFTDRAVMIDTAGRYTTQESDRRADAAAWHGFLSLLRRTRPREPINGVLLAVSVAELLEADDAQRALTAAALRARIHELSAHLRTRFPVYVLVTKADLLPGFTEFFADLDSDARAQVFGFTLPLEHATTATAPAASAPQPNLAAQVRRELEALDARLVARVLARTDQEPNVAARAAIIGFPQQFAAFRPLLETFLADVFIQSPARDAAFMRGVYITSGTQRGAPIDRVLATLKDALRLERAAPRPLRTAARSFFVRRMLTEVVFAEQGLAGSNLQWMRRRHLLRLAGFAAIGLAAALAVSLWSVSYLRNRTYVAAVDQAAHTLGVQAAALGNSNGNGNSNVSDAAHLTRALTLLSVARALASAPPIDAAHAPLTMQWGLWQGAKLDDAAQATYASLLDGWLLPYLSARAEANLREAARGTSAQAYDALKTYVSLFETQHQDSSAALRTWLLADASRLPGAQPGGTDRQALGKHVDALFEHGAVHSSRPFDAPLVAATRARLLRVALDQQVYERVRTAGVDSGCTPFTIARAGGPNAPLVFERVNGAPLSEGVPGLFTRECFYGPFLGAIDKYAKDVHDEASWVLGPGASGPDSAPEALKTGVRRLYAQDYIREWENYLGSIRLVPVQDLAQSAQRARLLAAPDSPLLAFVREAARETALSDAPKGEPSLTERAGQTFHALGNTVQQHLGGAAASAASATGPEQDVDNRFYRLHAIVDASAPGQPAPIVAAMALLNEVYVYLSALDGAMQQKVAPPSSDVLARLGALAGQLPEPLRTVLIQLGQSGAQRAQETKRGIASNDLRSLTAWCKRVVDGRYPFDPSARAEVPPQDFDTLFAPNGRLDAFFQKTLAADVDTSVHPWAYKKVDGSASAANAAGLADFERAATIRAVFFAAGNPTSALALNFKPVEMDPSILQFTLDIDGQLVSYAHGPQLATPVQWPAAHGASRVSVQLTPAPGSGAGPLSYDGPWALFRMLDRMKIEPTAQPERFFATFDVEGRQVRLEVSAGSVQSPFGLAELRAFRCPEGL